MVVMVVVLGGNEITVVDTVVAVVVLGGNEVTVAAFAASRCAVTFVPPTAPPTTTPTMIMIIRMIIRVPFLRR